MTEFSHVVHNLQSVLSTIAHESSIIGKNAPRLVAVSKTFPSEAILAAYQVGQRHFGENYVQELCTKADALKEQCPDIKWHFIGNLQSNKAKIIARVPNLAYIESVYNMNQVSHLQKALMDCPEKKLNIFLQVNTSDEESKGGVEPSDVVQLAKDIINNAPNLLIKGLMTIGSFTESIKDDENQDFMKLVSVRKILANELKQNEDDLELSMGMSSDFITAIKYGSTNVRVGSAIFGQRNYFSK